MAVGAAFRPNSHDDRRRHQPCDPTCAIDLLDHQTIKSRDPTHEVDFKGLGFEWLEVDNAEESIIAFLRKEKDPRNALLFAMNFAAVSRPEHRIGVPYPGAYTRIFSSNAAPYSGLNDGATNAVAQAEEIPWHGRQFSISIRLPALSAVVLKPAAPECRPYIF